MRSRPAGRCLTLVAVIALLAVACGSDQPPTGADTPPSPLEPSETATDEPSPPGSPSPFEDPTRTPDAAGGLDDVRLGYEVVAEGFESPVFVTHLLGTEDLLVLEQPGVVARAAEIGEITTWLDLSDRVGSGGNEQGLLGLALHPDFPDDDRVYVHYTDRDGATTLDVFRADTNGADPASRVNLLSIPQPAPNHNGGMLAFGPDGLLYLALGDGGGASDRFGNAQDTATLLGAILRLDVGSEGDSYTIPPGNPFAGSDDGAGEIWAYGLRNPWRFTFDGDRIFIGDVGQNGSEEISTVTLGAGAGTNFGWPVTEGNSCFEPPEGCDTTGLELPVITYPLGEGGTCSVVQGHTYRGSLHPALDGHTFYTDHCAGFLRSFRAAEDGEALDQRDWTGQVGVLEDATSFGLDHQRELLLAVRDGRILRVVPAG